MPVAATTTRIQRCHNCGRRVTQGWGHSIEPGWSSDKPVEDDDSCYACWPSRNLAAVMNAAEGAEVW